VLLIFAGCVSVPDGTPPVHTVTIEASAQNGDPITLDEAVNLAATELAVNVFSKKGEIKIRIMRNKNAADVTRRLFSELKMFVPVRSVLSGEDFTVESVFSSLDNGKKIWQLQLLDRNNRTVYKEVFPVTSHSLQKKGE
jgi:hypothetical protein